MYLEGRGLPVMRPSKLAHCRLTTFQHPQKTLFQQLLSNLSKNRKSERFRHIGIRLLITLYPVVKQPGPVWQWSPITQLIGTITVSRPGDTPALSRCCFQPYRERPIEAITNHADRSIIWLTA